MLQADGDVLFTPDPAFGGVRGFRYTVADSAGNPATQVIEVATGAIAPVKGSLYLLSPGMPEDPLVAEQWYLTDANVIPVWRGYNRQRAERDADPGLARPDQRWVGGGPDARGPARARRRDEGESVRDCPAGDFAGLRRLENAVGPKFM